MPQILAEAATHIAPLTDKWPEARDRNRPTEAAKSIHRKTAHLARLWITERLTALAWFPRLQVVNLKTSSSLIALCMAGTLCLGCKKSGDTPSTSAVPYAETPAAAPAKPSVRTKLKTLRPLLNEAARAELHAGGVFIDMGTADQHKFTRGGWSTGWGANTSEGSATLAQVEGGNTALDVDFLQPVSEVVLHARSSVAGQMVTLYFDGKATQSVAVPAAFADVRLSVGATPSTAGRHNVRLVWKSDGKPRAQIDWVWFPETAGGKAPLPVPRVMPLRMGNSSRRALVAPTPRTYSYYLEPPIGLPAQLVFDYGSSVGAEFAVRVTDGAEKTNELFKDKGTADWQEATVELTAYAGKALRIDLVTTGGEGVTGWGEPELMVTPDRAPAPVASAGKAKNLVFILIDTQRADEFGPINPTNTTDTPSYDELAKSSLVFTHAYNNENWTKPSVATSLTGLYPTTHTAKTDTASLPEAAELISEHLKKEGFNTVGLVANGYVSEKFGFQYGWDYFRNFIRENLRSEADNVYGEAIKWVKERKTDDRFFLYVHTIDPHVSYKADEAYVKRYHPAPYTGPLGKSIETEEQIKLGKEPTKFSDNDRDWVRSLYHAEVTFHDEQMGKFLAVLKEMNLMKDTMVIITNDHGEELGDHGRFGHGHSLHDELLHAPLLFHYEPIFKSAQFEDVVEHVDLAPTLVDALGVSPMKDADGVSMLPRLRGESVDLPGTAISEFAEGRRAIHVGGWKFERSIGTLRELYDIRNDVGEKTNLVEKNLIALRMCEIHLGEGLATPNKRRRLQNTSERKRFEAQKADIDPEMRRQLEALGYFGD